MAIAIFIVFCFLAMLFIAGKRINVVQLTFLGGTLALIAAFRPQDMPDWNSYWLFWNGLDGERFEYGFLFLAEILRKIDLSFHSFLLCCAVLAISLKIIAICNITPLILGSLVVYLGHIFILHDMIQIRCGIASSFFLLAIYSKVNHNLKKFIFFSFLAFLFHYSAIIIFPLWFLSTTRSHKYLYLILIVLCYLWGTSFPIANLIQYIPIAGIQNLWKMYEHTLGDEMNIFGIMQLFRLGICIFLFIFIDKISLYNKYAIFLLKIYALSIVAFVLFSGVPTMAQRISELYQVVEILLIPMLVYTIKCNIFIKRLCVVSFGFLFLWMHTFYLDHLH